MRTCFAGATWVLRLRRAARREEREGAGDESHHTATHQVRASQGRAGVPGGTRADPLHQARLIIAPSVARGRAAPAIHHEEARRNSDVFAGKWKQVRGQAKEWWGKLTDDDLERVEGQFDRLV